MKNMDRLCAWCVHHSVRAITYAIVTAAVTALPATYANAQEFHAKLSGFKEVGGVGAGQTGAIFSQGQGTLQLNLNRQLQSLRYTLTFTGLSAPVTQAHIHFGKKHVGGGIFLFLCTNLTPPAGVATPPACPATGGSVSGLLTAGSVLAVPGQHITAGDFNVVVEALLSKTAYANVHTLNFPAGEVRGEIRRDDDENNEDD